MRPDSQNTKLGNGGVRWGLPNKWLKSHASILNGMFGFSKDPSIYVILRMSCVSRVITLSLLMSHESVVEIARKVL